MNYTPNELQNLEFKKSLIGGYNEDMVNEVLDNIIDDYSSYIRENNELKDKLALLNEGLLHYKNIEESLQNTLLVAQQTAEEIRKNAFEKSENIIKEAELRAQKILNDAGQEVIRVKFELEETKKRLHLFRTKAETLLNTQLEHLKMLTEDEI